MNDPSNPDPNVENPIHELYPAPAATGPAGVEPRWPIPTPSADGIEWLRKLLNDARALHASDLLLVADSPATARVSGRLKSLGGPPLTAEAAGMLCAALVPDGRRLELQQLGTLDFAFARRGSGRFRCNLHRQNGYWAAAVRLLPETVPDFATLSLPAPLERFADLEYGLVLVTGPTGCGKSTTLAALVREILARRSVHLITIEDPVEYRHPHGNSVVEHIEIGRDTRSYHNALRAAMRQDPDVLLIGEMRDPESISSAITAAETGHLVLSTLHTGDGPQTIHRILDSYPGDQMEAVRAQLSVSLAGIVSQQLLPRKDGLGRVPAVEILVATYAVRNLIRRGRINQLRSQIGLEKSSGMLGLDRSLARLAMRGLVNTSEARARARVPQEFDLLMRHNEPG